MGKMLDAFEQARSRRNANKPASPTLSAIWPDEDPDTNPDECDMPFVEVGGPRQDDEPVQVVFPELGPPLTPEPAPADPSPSGLLRVRFQALDRHRALAHTPSSFAPELIAHHQPEHAISGQYRDLTTHLLTQTPIEQPQVLLFSGSAPVVGSTTVVLNTAITLARHNLRRVVVIDAHLRKPAVAARVGLVEGPGLRDVLAGRMLLDGALRATGLVGLTVLTAGSAASVSPVRLAGEGMRAILRQLRDRYDLVLLDAPCWDGRPEVVALAAACDAVYLCLPEEVQGTPEADELQQLVTEQGASLRGCILTGR